MVGLGTARWSLFLAGQSDENALLKKKIEEVVEELKEIENIALQVGFGRGERLRKIAAIAAVAITKLKDEKKVQQ